MDIVQQFLQLLPRSTEIENELMNKGRRLTPQRLFVLVSLWQSKHSLTKAMFQEVLKSTPAGVLADLPDPVQQLRQWTTMTNVLRPICKMGLVKRERSRGKASLFRSVPRVERILHKHAIEPCHARDVVGNPTPAMWMQLHLSHSRSAMFMDTAQQFLQLLPRSAAIRDELMSTGKRLTPSRLFALVALWQSDGGALTKDMIRQAVVSTPDALVVELPESVQRMQRPNAVTKVLIQLCNMGLVEREAVRGEPWRYHRVRRVCRVLRKQALMVRNGQLQCQAT